VTTKRVAKSASDTLSHTFYVGEQPTDPGTPTYLITDATGATVASGSATSAGAGTGTVTAPLAAQSALKTLTVAWAGTIGGATVTETDTVEICGGFLFGLVEGRASDSSLADTNKYTTQDLIDARQATEEECEWITANAWTLRYRRVVLDGTGTSDLALPDGGDIEQSGIVLRGVRTIRSASVAPRIGQTFVALTAGQLAALAVTTDGLLRRTDGDVWPEGLQNVLLEYEYGNDASPADLKRAMTLRFRSRLNISKTNIPDRATSFSSVDGGTYRLSLPDAYRTGLPDVDGPYARYSRRARGGTGQTGNQSVPASRTLTYTPQRNSIFHQRNT